MSKTKRPRTVGQIIKAISDSPDAPPGERWIDDPLYEQKEKEFLDLLMRMRAIRHAAFEKLVPGWDWDNPDYDRLRVELWRRTMTDRAAEHLSWTREVKLVRKAARRRDADHGDIARRVLVFQKRLDKGLAAIIKPGSRQEESLLALHKVKAFSREESVITEKIAVVARGPQGNSENFKYPVRHLREKGLVETQRAPGGGVWLTALGREIADSICLKGA